MMTKKSYADQCLERASMATPGPWVRHSKSPKMIYTKAGIPAGDMTDEIIPYLRINDAKFIAAARTDVPELARRLKIAIDSLRIARMYEGDNFDKLAYELEAPSEEK